MEGDTNLSYSVTKVIQFLSTPSAWRATGREPVPEPGRMISIHALRMEGDFDDPV